MLVVGGYMDKTAHYVGIQEQSNHQTRLSPSAQDLVPDRLHLSAQGPADEPVYQFLNKKCSEGKPYFVYMTAA